VTAFVPFFLTVYAFGDFSQIHILCLNSDVKRTHVCTIKLFFDLQMLTMDPDPSAKLPPPPVGNDVALLKVLFFLYSGCIHVVISVITDVQVSKHSSINHLSL